MKHLRVLFIALLALLPSLALAQSPPNPLFTFGYVPTAGQWNALFSAKQDVLNYTPINQAGGTMTGKLTIFASAVGASGFNMQPGVAPSAPNNGDMWLTSAGLYVQVNGVTMGPLSGASAASFAATAPIALNFSGALTTVSIANGTSVANPGTGTLEDLMAVQTVAGASKTFATADLFKKTRRSNSGVAMTDTFPASNATGLVNGTRIVVANVDATASITITAGAGTVMASGGATDTVGPGRDVAYEYDVSATQWRGAYNTRTALLAANNLSEVASAATARANIGAAASGANTDITSLNPASPGTIDDMAIGQTTPKAGSFTTLTLTGLNITGGAASVGGRLTLTTGTPVLTGSVAAAGTVYFTPYLGNLIPLWNGTQFVWTPCAETSNVLANSSTGNAGPSAAAASQVYDLYEWNNGGACTLTRSPAWSAGTGGSNTARGTGAGGSAQTRVSGILTNTVAITNGPGAGAGTYVGTIATDGSGGTVSWSRGGAASGGTAATLNVWNMFNRVSVSAAVTDSGANYTYTSATIRQARASAGNQIIFVVGEQEDGTSFTYLAHPTTSGAINAFVILGVGLDSTTAFVQQRSILVAPTANQFQTTLANSGTLFPGIGTHIISANEASDGTNANVFNQDATNVLSAAMRM